MPQLDPLPRLVRIGGVGMIITAMVLGGSAGASAAPTISAVSTGVSWVEGDGSPIETGESPRRVVVSPDGARAYVIEADGDLVEVIDTATNTIIDDVAVANPLGLEISPDGGTLYVLNHTVNTITVIDTDPLAIVDDFAVESDAYGVELSADGSTIFVVASSTVRPYSVAGVALQPALDPGVGGSITLATSPDSATLWAAGYNGDSVAIDVASWTAGTPITTGSTPLFGTQDITVSPDNSLLLVANALGDAIVLIDIATETVLGSIPDVESPDDVAFSPDGSLGYGMAFNGGQPAGFVLVFDVPTLTPRDAFGTLATPTDMTLSPDGSRIYIVNEDLDRVEAFNTRTLSLSGPGEIQQGTPTTAFAASILDGLNPNGVYSDFILRVFDANDVQVASVTLPVPASGVASIVVPTAALPPGTYSLSLQVGDEPGPLVVIANGFIVHAALAATGTGASSAVVGGAALLLAAGVAALMIARRRTA